MIQGIGPASTATRRQPRPSALGTPHGAIAVDSGREEDGGDDVITKANLVVGE